MAYFAIKGKPGSGKSTLLRYLYDSMASNRSPNHRGTILRIAFFFNERGSPNDSSALGMLRGLLHQLLSCNIQLYRSILRDLREIAKRVNGGAISSIVWTEQTLRTLLMLTVQRAKTLNIIAFIDALDECIESDRNLVVFFSPQVVYGGT
jgi:ankyrin repeat domain-containing protein 50